MSEKSEQKESSHQGINYESVFDEIACLITARVPIIWVTTHEENRFLSLLEEKVARRLKKTVMVWSSYQGIVGLKDAATGARAEGELSGTWEPGRALDYITTKDYVDTSSSDRGKIYVLRDFYTYLAPPQCRQLRDIYKVLPTDMKTIIITAPIVAYGTTPGLPPNLEKQITIVDFPLPSLSELKTMLLELLPKLSDQRIKTSYTDLELELFARALQGLTWDEANTAALSSIVYLREIKVEKLIQEKKRIIAKSDVLEFIQNPPAITEIGGLDKAIDYFKMYSSCHTEEAKAFGVESLKGVLLLGIPGSGKSLLAKAISSEWKLPVLRLDVGKVMSGIVGSSENRMRQVISQAESMAPVILWIDEVEKALSGTKSSNFSDGGTMARVFGTLLQAMQEGLSGVTIIATANDISALPPEFIRRFNDVFFMDLPGPNARKEIFRIHLRKRSRDPEKFDLDRLAEKSYQYTGAEIEKAIKDAIASSFKDRRMELRTEDLVNSLAETKPIVSVMEEQIKTIRQWAKDRAKYASSEPLEKHKATKKSESISALDIS